MKKGLQNSPRRTHDFATQRWSIEASHRSRLLIEDMSANLENAHYSNQQVVDFPDPRKQPLHDMYCAHPVKGKLINAIRRGNGRETGRKEANRGTKHGNTKKLRQVTY